MKKLIGTIAIVTALVLVCAFAAGCSLFGGNDDTQKDDPNDNVTVSADDGKVADAMRKVIRGLTDGMDGMEFSQTSFGAYEHDGSAYYMQNRLNVVSDREGDDGLAVRYENEKSEGSDKSAVQSFSEGNSYHAFVSVGGEFYEADSPDGEYRQYSDASELNEFVSSFGALFAAGGITDIFDGLGIDVYSDWTLPEVREAFKAMPIKDMYDLFFDAMIDGQEAMFGDIEFSDMPDDVRFVFDIFGRMSLDDVNSFYENVGNSYSFLAPARGLAFEFIDYIIDDFLVFTVSESDDGTALVITADPSGKYENYIKRITEILEPPEADLCGVIEGLFGVNMQKAYENLSKSFGPKITLEDAVSIVAGFTDDFGISAEDIISAAENIGMLAAGYYDANSARTLDEVVPDIFGCSYDGLISETENMLGGGVRFDPTYELLGDFITAEQVKIDFSLSFGIRDGVLADMEYSFGGLLEGYARDIYADHVKADSCLEFESQGSAVFGNDITVSLPDNIMR